MLVHLVSLAGTLRFGPSTVRTRGRGSSAVGPPNTDCVFQQLYETTRSFGLSCRVISGMAEKRFFKSFSEFPLPPPAQLATLPGLHIYRIPRGDLVLRYILVRAGRGYLACQVTCASRFFFSLFFSRVCFLVCAIVPGIAQSNALFFLLQHQGFKPTTSVRRGSLVFVVHLDHGAVLGLQVRRKTEYFGRKGDQICLITVIN